MYSAQVRAPHYFIVFRLTSLDYHQMYIIDPGCELTVEALLNDFLQVAIVYDATPGTAIFIFLDLRLFLVL